MQFLEFYLDLEAKNIYCPTIRVGIILSFQTVLFVVLVHSWLLKLYERFFVWW